MIISVTELFCVVFAIRIVKIIDFNIVAAAPTTVHLGHCMQHG